MLNEQQKRYLIDLIEAGKEIPEDFKALLFPIDQKEYELTYGGKMRREDLLANEDGTFPVPLQIEKIYNQSERADQKLSEKADLSDGISQLDEFGKEWRNLIVFGDNLQFLKTIYENRDPLVKDKVKGKIALIYIDPPFATEEEFKSSVGAMAYSDKRKSAEFLEFLRRRLIVAREILAEDGVICVHLDQKMGHYIKVVMDEIFGKSNFINEIIWHYKSGGAGSRSFARKHDVILMYGKTGAYQFFPLREKSYNRDFKPYRFEKVEEFQDEIGWYTLVNARDVWEINMVGRTSGERLDYPTQKPEALLEKIMAATTKEGDLVLDFFGGSGTTMAVAEKLGRRWITCDSGKLSYFVMQKRLLRIQDSGVLNGESEFAAKETETESGSETFGKGKALLSEESAQNVSQCKPASKPGQKYRKGKKKETIYGKLAKPFMTVKLGMYDLEKTFRLDWETYCRFAAALFEVELRPQRIGGMSFDGEKKGYPVKIFDYLRFEDSAIDEVYLKHLHENIGSGRLERVYLIAPATRVNFLADYEELEGTRYYFLQVPYEMIRELHKAPFQKLRQPTSRNEINRMEEMKGFQFVYPPEVDAEIISEKGRRYLVIRSFYNDYIEDAEENSFQNFETLSSIYIDYDYDGEAFVMDEALFAEELLPKKRGRGNGFDMERVGDELRIPLPEEGLGDRMMVVFSDIYGNDFVEQYRFEVDG